MYHLQTILYLIRGPSARSLILNKTRRGPKINPCGTPGVILVRGVTCPFKVTLCFLSFKKSDKTLSSLPEIPVCFGLKIISSCQTLSNAFKENTSYIKPVIKRLIFHGL